MMRKLIALALVGGGAAYLFKTKKGAEYRTKLSETATQLKDMANEYYQKQKANAATTTDAV